MDWNLADLFELVAESGCYVPAPCVAVDHDRVAGGTVYWLDDLVDGGPIAAQDWCFVRPDDTPSTLWRRELFPMGLRLIDQVLGDLALYEAMAQQDSAAD